MENEYLQMLVRIVLPAQLLDYFTVSGVEQTSTEIHISLDEKMSPSLSEDVHFESKGFMEAVNGTRTRDIQLGKLALYQLSQTRILNTEAHQNPASRSLLMRFVGTRQAKSDHFRRLPII